MDWKSRPIFLLWDNDTTLVYVNVSCQTKTIWGFHVHRPRHLPEILLNHTALLQTTAHNPPIRWLELVIAFILNLDLFPDFLFTTVKRLSRRSRHTAMTPVPRQALIVVSSIPLRSLLILQASFMQLFSSTKEQIVCAVLSPDTGLFYH